MKLTQRLRDWYHERRAFYLASKGHYQGAVEQIKNISSREEQARLTANILSLDAIKAMARSNEDEFFNEAVFSLELFIDSEAYERAKAVAGRFNSRKIMLYFNPETGVAHGLDDLINGVIDSQNPLMVHWRNLGYSASGVPINVYELLASRYFKQMGGEKHTISAKWKQK